MRFAKKYIMQNVLQKRNKIDYTERKIWEDRIKISVQTSKGRSVSRWKQRTKTKRQSSCLL